MDDSTAVERTDTEATKGPGPATDPKGPSGDRAGADSDGEAGGPGGPLKIAIVGTAPGWEKAPFDDESWHIWGLSRSYNHLPRFNAWFELHRLDEIAKTWDGHEDMTAERHRQVYLDWLRQASEKIPVFMQKPTPEVPNAQAYPLDEILKLFPRQYFTNSISYMLAMAISLKPKAIGVWGVDMALNPVGGEMNGEYRAQRPSCEYFLGIAEGAGIEVSIPHESDLLKCRHLYAYGDSSAMSAKLQYKMHELLNRKAHMEQAVREGEKRLAAVQGCIDMVRYVEENWHG